jgi:hypothetical protein
MTGDSLYILPPDRQMTAEECRGFRIALGCIHSWGTQITAASISLPAPVWQEKPMHAQERLGRQLCAMAEALDRTIGQRGF